MTRILTVAERILDGGVDIRTYLALVISIDTTTAIISLAAVKKLLPFFLWFSTTLVG
jgi:hypothetical protein